MGRVTACRAPKQSEELREPSDRSLRVGEALGKMWKEASVGQASQAFKLYPQIKSLQPNLRKKDK